MLEYMNMTGWRTNPKKVIRHPQTGQLLLHARCHCGNLASRDVAVNTAQSLPGSLHPEGRQVINETSKWIGYYKGEG